MLNDFYDSNKACCPPCEAELDNFKTCKSCDGDAVPDTTPDTTTTTQAPPPPDTTTTETDPPPPPDTTTQAPPPPDTNTVEATPSPTKSPTTSPTLTPLTESPTIGSTDSPTPKETALPPFGDSMSMSMSMDIPTSAPTNVPPTEAPKGEIMGVVFEDTNGNGVPDPGEPGLAGVVVIITDTFGFFQTVTTDGRGVYEAIVPAGPAVIDIVETSLPPGAQQTAGTDPTTVIVPAGGRATDLDGYFVPTDAPTRAPTTASPTDAPTRAPTTASPTETPTRAPTTASPTETPTGKIKGIVFEDINGNGAMDPNEPGLAGVVVIITDTFGFFQTVTTDGAGMYEAVVPAGPAVTDIVETSLPPGAQQTAGSDPTTVDVPAGGTATDLDGYNVPTDSPTSAPTVFPPTSPPTEVCIVPGCCVEDWYVTMHEDTFCLSSYLCYFVVAVSQYQLHFYLFNQYASQLWSWHVVGQYH